MIQKYTKNTLTEINNRFCSHHCLDESDVNKANFYVKWIEYTRSTIEPRVGDIIRYTNEYGDYYATAHIEKVYENGDLYICEQPYTPFISIYKNEIYCNTSGGAWATIPNDITYIGKQKKRFCDWGNCGACANGSIEFDAEVSIWEYIVKENKFIGTNGIPFTTKEFNRMKIHSCPNPKEHPYHYIGDGFAWKSDLEMQAWLRTYRAEVFDWGYNGMFVWYWKEEIHSVSPQEFEILALPEDTLRNNASILRCKRQYDENTHTIHRYWVWYWKDHKKDWKTASIEQNKIRNELYTLDYHTPVNQYAINEILSGKVTPIDLTFLKKGYL